MFRTNSEASSSSVPVTAVGPGVFWSSRAVSEHQKGCGFGNCRIMGVSTMFGWDSPSHLNIDTDIVGLSNLTNKCNKSKHVFSRCWIQPLVSNVLDLYRQDCKAFPGWEGCGREECNLQHALVQFATEYEMSGMRVSTPKSLRPWFFARKRVEWSLWVGGERLP